MDTVYRVSWVYHAQQPTVTQTVTYKTVVNHKTFRSKSNAATFQKKVNDAYDVLVMPNRASMEEITLEDTMFVVEGEVADEKPVSILVDWTE